MAPQDGGGLRQGRPNVRRPPDILGPGRLQAEVRLKPEHLAGQGGGADRISAAEVGLGYRVHAESRNIPEHPMGLFQDGCMGNAYAA